MFPNIYKKELESQRKFAYNFYLKKDNEPSPLIKSGLQQVASSKLLEADKLDVSVKDLDLISLQRNYENLSDLLKRERTRSNSLVYERDNLLQENQKLKEYMKEMNVKLEESNSNYEKLRTQLSLIEDTLSKQNKKSQNEQVKNSKEKEEINKIEIENRMLRLLSEKLKSENQKLLENESSFKKEIETNNQELIELMRLKKLNEEMESIKAENRKMNEELSLTRLKMGELKEENNRLKENLKNKDKIIGVK